MNRPSNDLAEYDHIDLLFPSRYLKGADLRGRDVTVTISAVEPRHELKKFGGKGREEVDYKTVVYFAGKSKGMVLNRTNGDSIVSLHGIEATGWIGKQVTLYPLRGKFFGKICDVVRIRADVAKVAKYKQERRSTNRPVGDEMRDEPQTAMGAGVGMYAGVGPEEWGVEKDTHGPED